jgi:hypothetical protein
MTVYRQRKDAIKARLTAGEIQPWQAKAMLADVQSELLAKRGQHTIFPAPDEAPQPE